MAGFEIHVELGSHTHYVGLARSHGMRGAETVVFEYDHAWLANPLQCALVARAAIDAGPVCAARGTPVICVHHPLIESGSMAAIGIVSLAFRRWRTGLVLIVATGTAA